MHELITRIHSPESLYDVIDNDNESCLAGLFLFDSLPIYQMPLDLNPLYAFAKNRTPKVGHHLLFCTIGYRHLVQRAILWIVAPRENSES